MHRALRIPEIVLTIMQMFSSSPRDFWFLPCDPTLFNAALTCRAFSEPALDVLWYYMTSLKPLFKLLSNFQSLNSNDLTDDLIWGSISKTDIRTVKKYASRIRYYHSGGDNISVFAYIHLLRACGHPCLLPNLAYLYAHLNDHSADTSKIVFLISPLLREVDVDTLTASSLIPVLNSLQTHSPNLAILKISTGLFNAHCMSAICPFPQLQEVIIHGYDSGDELSLMDFFTHTSSNQTLRQFSLFGDMRLVSSNADPGYGTVAFPALESIDLHCLLTSINPITTLLCYVALPSLKSLLMMITMSSVEPIKSIEDQCWIQFFNLIGNVMTNHFKTLQISGHQFEEVDASYSLWKDVNLTVSKFLNLDKLSLEDFTIGAPILHSLHHNDVQKIINTWPGLRYFHLTSCRPFKLGFDVLLDIALGLPSLYRLALSMDLQQLPSLEAIPLLAHGLDRLELEISSMEPDSIMEFAQCIDKIFPRIDSWSFKCSNYPAFHQKATSILIALQRARKYEVKRVSLGMHEVNDK